MNYMNAFKSEYTTINFKNIAIREFVSVIIPVYNDPSGLVDTLTSLSNQNLDKSRYEIIVANDGGAESISAVCREFTVKEVKINPNRGSYFARNRAIEKSRGEFIACIDADITVSPDWLENGLRALSFADYIGGPVHIDKEKITEPAHYSEYRTAFPFKEYLNKKNFSGAGNLFVRRSVFEEIGGFDERLQSGGDKEFGKRVYETGNFRQFYEDGIAAIHPPRGYKKLVNQRIRIAKGDKVLSVLYPDRFVSRKPSIIPLLFTMLLPPRIKNVKRGYNDQMPFSFLQYYLFLWKYKIEVTIKLIPVFYLDNTAGKVR